MEIQWALVLFTAVAGTGAWLFAFSTIAALAKKDELPTKNESIVSFVLLVVGGCLSVLHLSHPDRIMEALNRPTSGIFIEASLIGVICVLIAVYFIMLVRKTGEGPRKVVAIIAAVVCIVFSYACGSSYMMASRAAWNTFALPLGYCATAALSGAGLAMLMKALRKREAAEADSSADGDAGTDAGIGEIGTFMGLMAFIAGVASLVIVAVFCVQAASYIADPSTGAVLWVVIAFVAIAVAAAVGWLVKGKGASMGLAVAVLVAGFLAAVTFRVVMWLIGTQLLNFFLMPLG